MKEKTYWRIGMCLGGGVVLCGFLGLITLNGIFLSIGIGFLFLAGLYLVVHKWLVPYKQLHR